MNCPTGFMFTISTRAGYARVWFTIDVNIFVTCQWQNMVRKKKGFIQGSNILGMILP